MRQALEATILELAMELIKNYQAMIIRLIDQPQQTQIILYLNRWPTTLQNTAVKELTVR